MYNIPLCYSSTKLGQYHGLLWAGHASTVLKYKLTEKLLQKLKSFYVQNFIPVLVKCLCVPGVLWHSDVTNSGNLDDLYCYYQDKEHGKITMREITGCHYICFHYDCIRIRYVVSIPQNHSISSD